MKRLTEVDLAKYRELVHVAQNTPVITMKSGEEDWATRAWRNVQSYMQEMAKKYEYPYDKHIINMKTGEILTIKQAEELEKKNDTEK